MRLRSSFSPRRLLRYYRPVKLTLLGATGRIGRHVLEQALQNHELTVLVRDPARLGESSAHVLVAIRTDCANHRFGAGNGGVHRLWLIRRLARHVVGAKQAEYDELARSDLEWIAVRPAIVTDGPLTGRYISGPDALRAGARVSRADVAHLMLAEAEAPTHIGHPGIFVRSA